MRILKFLSRDDSHYFKPILTEIEETPPNPLGSLVLWVIITIIFVSIIWLTFGETEIVVSGQGKFVPSGKVKIVQPLETGVIRKILCDRGDEVTKGQLLVEIDPSATDPAIESLREELKIYEITIMRLESLVSGSPFVPDEEVFGKESVQVQRDIYTSLRNGHQKQIAAKNDELQKSKQQLKSFALEKEGYKDLLVTYEEQKLRLDPIVDIIPRNEYNDLLRKILQNKIASNNVSAKIKEVTTNLELLQHQKEALQYDFINKLSEELAESSMKLASTKARLDRISFSNKKQNIVSPVTGAINEVFITTEGGVVTPAEKLMSIVPKNSPLIVETKVLNKDVGFIEKDMPVTVKVNAFTYQRYGTLEGTVSQISKDSIKDEKLGEIYKVYISVNDPRLKVEGEMVPMSSGMTVLAEINVGTRRLIEFFIYPLIKYLDEGLSVQ
ncbi:HlyD family type I secretion periplasmic adaptor subunit [Halodesulfovibrio aestuarii]|uniref:HlyD family type I secretion periplasmic adaptor subunit n=1 Tax=Halodesulfovibrio aestuarii TaxID=126333 RepID=UPI003D3462C5